MKINKLKAVVGVFIVAAVTMAGSIATGSGASPSADKVERAESLTRSEPSAGQLHREAALRARADELSAAVPLPDGGNLNGVQWETLGVATEGQVRRIQQYNALCQWARAVADGRESQTASAVIEKASRWPAIRELEDSANAKQITQSGPQGVAFERFLIECRASHDSEVGYARGRGLSPSR